MWAAFALVSRRSLHQSWGQPTSHTPFLVVAIVGTAAFLWSASAAVALSVGSGSLVAVLQNWLLSRDPKPTA